MWHQYYKTVELAWYRYLRKKSRSFLMLDSLEWLIGSFIDKGLLEYCVILEEQGSLVFLCEHEALARFLSCQRSKLAVVAKQAGYSSEIILKVKGVVINTIPLNISDKHHNIMPQTSTLSNISGYKELMQIALDSEYETYITLLPSNWQWGIPIRCILTGADAKKFSRKLPFQYHGQDMTVLYGQSEMERQTGILVREIERSPKSRVFIKDVEYLTYLSDTSRQDVLQKTPENSKVRFNADFEIFDLDGIGRVRICHCKEHSAA